MEMLVLQMLWRESKQYISSQNMFPQELATWDCIELGHGNDQPMHAGCGIDLLKNKSNENILTTIATGVMKSGKSTTVMKWSTSTDNILDLQCIVYRLKETRRTLCNTGTDKPPELAAGRTLNYHPHIKIICGLLSLLAH